MCKVIEEMRLEEREEGRREGEFQALCSLVYKGLLSFMIGVQESGLPKEVFLKKIEQLYPDFVLSE